MNILCRTFYVIFYDIKLFFVNGYVVRDFNTNETRCDVRLTYV